MKETEILGSICDYLALKRYFFWRENTAGLFREGRYFSLPKHDMRGKPDISLIKSDGQYVGIEVKSQKGKLSEYQKAFRDALPKGALYIVDRSLDDVIAYGL